MAARLVGPVLVVMLCAGCAAVSSQEKPKSDGPEAGARIIPEGGATCTTPCRIDLSAYPDEFELRIEVEGFQSGRVMIRRNGQFWQADITGLGRTPCLAIVTRTGDVYAADPGDVLRVRPADAMQAGVGEPDVLGAVVVPTAEPSWQRIVHLWPQ